MNEFEFFKLYFAYQEYAKVVSSFGQGASFGCSNPLMEGVFIVPLNN